MATLAVQTGGKAAPPGVPATAATTAAAVSPAPKEATGAAKPKVKPPPRKKNQQGFDELIKCARAICKELLLPPSSVNNPILARINQLTNTAVGGPFPPPLLTLSDASISHSHLHLLLRLLTCRAGLRYQASFNDSLPSYTGLRNLQLWGAPVGDQGARRLADALPELPAVRTLCLYNCQLTAHGCTFLSTYLAQRDTCTLTALTLDHNRIGTEGLSNLMLGMKRHCALTKLSLAYCELDATSCSVIQSLLLLPSSNLTSLVVRGNALTHTVLASLADAVHQGSGVLTVDLTSTSICCVHEKAEMRHLLAALSQRSANAQTGVQFSATATSSSLSQPSTTAISTRVLPGPPRALSSTATITTSNATAPASATSASSTPTTPLQVPSGLRQLLLVGNVLGDDMMVEIVAALQRCPQIAEFEVSAFVEPMLYKQLRAVLRDNRVRIAEIEGAGKKAKSKKGKSKKKKKR